MKLWYRTWFLYLILWNNWRIKNNLYCKNRTLSYTLGVLYFNFKNIMLKEMWSYIKQLPFEAWSVLRNLNLLPLDTEENRLQFMIEVLRYKDALNIKLIDNVEFFNERAVRQLIADASSNITKQNIISHKFSWILYNLNYEFYKKNNWQFDFNIFKDYLEWKAKYEDFIKTPLRVTEANTVWSFVWLDWKSYTWKWLSDLSSLKWDDIKNMITWYKTDDADMRKAIEFLYDIKNEKIIKKTFGNVRSAWLSIIKSIIWNKNLQEPILNLIK